MGKGKSPKKAGSYKQLKKCTMSDKTKQLIKNIIVAVLSAILTWLGVSCTNMLTISKNNKGSNQTIENKTSGEATADSTSINFLNNKT